MTWLPPENDLVAEQNRFLHYVWNNPGNCYVSGFPGSGKSVCLLYAVKMLKRNPNVRILFVEFTHALINMIRAALSELRLENISAVTYQSFRKSHLDRYDVIISDEIQDMPASILKLMRQHASRVIVGGDPHQSIYKMMPDSGESPASQEVMKNILDPKVFELTIIHRLNKFVIRSINSFMPDMHILAEKSSMMKKHLPVYIWPCRNQADEVGWIKDEAQLFLNRGRSVAVLLHRHEDIEKFVNIYLKAAGKPEFDFKRHRFYEKPDYKMLNSHFDAHGVKMQSIINRPEVMIGSDKICLSTYHSAKGLDWDRVYMPFCNPNECKDPRLFMVAMSRSRMDLILSYTLGPNQFIQSFLDNRKACQVMDKYGDKTSEGDSEW